MAAGKKIEVAGNKHMIVGLDGSPDSAVALRWAEARVEEFGKIQPVTTWTYPWWAMTSAAPGTPPPPSDADLRSEAERLARQMLDPVDPAVRLKTLAIRGSAGPALVELGSDASLIVVGSRGRGSLASTLLGSVSLHCVNHATVPVAVIPSDARPTSDTQRVVVGIDGSDHSVSALRWALDHTESHTLVEAVYVWDPDMATTAQVPAMAREHLHAEAKALASETVARAQDGAHGDRAITTLTPCGDPRMVLREASHDADLLVMGARGRHGVAYLLVGSVASALVGHPETATVVVR